MPPSRDRHANGGWRVGAPDPLDPAPVRPLALLVDDASDVLVTISAFLEAAGFDVVRAGNGQEAMACVIGGRRFVLLVTDYAMPGLNGADLAAQALRHLPALKALIITGFPRIDGLAELPRGVAVLARPFRRAELIAQLKSWFDTAPAILPASHS